MNRRGFLSLIAPAAAALIVPQLLVPKRTIFLPPRGGWSEFQEIRVDDVVYLYGKPQLPIAVRLYGTSWIDTLKAEQLQEIVRAFGVPPHLLGNRRRDV